MIEKKKIVYIEKPSDVTREIPIRLLPKLNYYFNPALPLSIIDPYIRPILRAINEDGYKTVYSCSGLQCEHRRRPIIPGTNRRAIAYLAMHVPPNYRQIIEYCNSKSRWHAEILENELSLDTRKNSPTLIILKQTMLTFSLRDDLTDPEVKSEWIKLYRILRQFSDKK